MSNPPPKPPGRSTTEIPVQAGAGRCFRCDPGSMKAPSPKAWKTLRLWSSTALAKVGKSSLATAVAAWCGGRATSSNPRYPHLTAAEDDTTELVCHDG